MIIYDEYGQKHHAFVRMLMQREGSGLIGALPFTFLSMVYATCVILHVVRPWRHEFVPEDAEDKTDFGLPSLKGLSVVASFMLAMQTKVTFNRFVHGVSATVELETASNELMRYVCMILDVPGQQDLRDEIRRVLLAVLVEIVVEVRTLASFGILEKAVGDEVLKRAVGEGLLSKAERDQSLAHGCLLSRSTLATECQKKVTALLFAERHQFWREKWLDEAQRQPIINLVGKFSVHWTAILAVASVMRQELSSTAFPLNFMQLSRVVWGVSMLLYPWVLAESMGLSALLFQLLFCLAFFPVDMSNCDMESPFGFNQNSIPLEAMLCRVEASTATLLDATTTNLNQAGGVRAPEAKRFDMHLVLDPLLQGFVANNNDEERKIGNGDGDDDDDDDGFVEKKEPIPPEDHPARKGWLRVPSSETDEADEGKNNAARSVEEEDEESLPELPSLAVDVAEEKASFVALPSLDSEKNLGSGDDDDGPERTGLGKLGSSSQNWIKNTEKSLRRKSMGAGSIDIPSTSRSTIDMGSPSRSMSSRRRAELEEGGSAAAAGFRSRSRTPRRSASRSMDAGRDERAV